MKPPTLPNATTARHARVGAPDSRLERRLHLYALAVEVSRANKVGRHAARQDDTVAGAQEGLIPDAE